MSLSKPSDQSWYCAECQIDFERIGTYCDSKQSKARELEMIGLATLRPIERQNMLYMLEHLELDKMKL